ncbi:MAG: hypothetical protein K6G44_14970 [Lentisphaeria bacterium]|nr:hypothetical protein [Lentisphaeria bacterium]
MLVVNAICDGYVAPFGRYVVGGLAYRQLRLLRSLASGYDCVALRADDAAEGGYDGLKRAKKQ